VFHILLLASTTKITDNHLKIMIKVFYDGKCGLCSREINHYRKIAPDGIFEWQDITENFDGLTKQGISLSEGLKLLHAMDNNGKIHIGVEAFILIWEQLKRWKVLAILISLPVIKQIANYVYTAFADWRFKKLAHCQQATKQG
jgi:predicted DCC family thiol-disulfide oxidoreductase YuxK